MGIIAVLTNTTLMAMSPEIREFLPEMTATNYILLFVAVEVWSFKIIYVFKSRVQLGRIKSAHRLE